MFYTFLKYVPEKEYSTYYFKRSGIVTVNVNHVTSITNISAEVELEKYCLLVITTSCGSTFVCEPQDYDNFHRLFGDDNG